MPTTTSWYLVCAYLDEMVEKMSSVCWTVWPLVQVGAEMRCPELSKPFCEPGAPCRSINTLRPRPRAQSMAASTVGVC